VIVKTSFEVGKNRVLVGQNRHTLFLGTGKSSFEVDKKWSWDHHKPVLKSAKPF